MRSRPHVPVSWRRPEVSWSRALGKTRGAARLPCCLLQLVKRSFRYGYGGLWLEIAWQHKFVEGPSSMHQMVICILELGGVCFHIKMLWQVVNGESISCVFFPFKKAYEVCDAASFPQYQASFVGQFVGVTVCDMCWMLKVEGLG